MKVGKIPESTERVNENNTVVNENNTCQKHIICPVYSHFLLTIPNRTSLFIDNSFLTSADYQSFIGFGYR